MKVGSLVELVDDNWHYSGGHTIYPIKNKVYTVRDIRHLPYDLYGVSLLLEEIKNPMHWSGVEYAFVMNRFRELLPPINIAEVIEKEMQLEIKL